LEYYSNKGSTKVIIPYLDFDATCHLCKVREDSLQHLFFNCVFARVVCRYSFWVLDSTTLDLSNMLNWIKIIISLGSTLHILKVDHYRFQIFAAVTCDLLWFYCNKAFHNGISYNALQVLWNIN
jgi:hypothetical protein